VKKDDFGLRLAVLDDQEDRTVVHAIRGCRALCGLQLPGDHQFLGMGPDNGGVKALHRENRHQQTHVRNQKFEREQFLCFLKSWRLIFRGFRTFPDGQAEVPLPPAHSQKSIGAGKFGVTYSIDKKTNVAMIVRV